MFQGESIVAEGDRFYPDVHWTVSELDTSEELHFLCVGKSEMGLGESISKHFYFAHGPSAVNVTASVQNPVFVARNSEVSVRFSCVADDVFPDDPNYSIWVDNDEYLSPGVLSLPIGIHNVTCVSNNSVFPRDFHASDSINFVVKEDLCLDDVCKNGGSCTNVNDDYACVCELGWAGRNCTLYVEDRCKKDPCQNGGRCVNKTDGGGFSCECVEGWTGSLCGKIVEKVVPKHNQLPMEVLLNMAYGEALKQEHEVKIETERIIRRTVANITGYSGSGEAVLSEGADSMTLVTVVVVFNKPVTADLKAKVVTKLATKVI